MHMIECVIKPPALNAVKSRLAQMGILGVTALECKGFGKQKGHTERYRGARMDVGFVPKVLLKIAVRDADLDQAIPDHRRGGSHGPDRGRQAVCLPVGAVVRIRTGETDDSAL